METFTTIHLKFTKIILARKTKEKKAKESKERRWCMELCCWLWWDRKEMEEKRGICVKMRWERRKKRRQAVLFVHTKMKIEWVANFFIPLFVPFRVKSCHPHTFTPPPPRYNEEISCDLHDSTHFYSNATFFLSFTLVSLLLAGSSNLFGSLSLSFFFSL